MPVQRGPRPSTNFSSTNSKLRKEIANDLLSQLTNINQLMRNQNSIVTSDNFHVDSRMMTSGTYNGSYKVDIQYKSPKQGSTVGEIMLSPTATNLADAITGLTSSVNDDHIYIVT